ncbi:asparaginase [Natrinema halophilum]|uniref:L-asparaginase n=1 Tax=Natrinema halophilum TaxID=1699371 RepID=A0A7D5GK94_9EURY|nr:asparaginase [Natrinema halophilum]QLG51234.1 asparaginase [Natrinema halophilum]
MHVTVLSTGGTIASTDGDDGASPTKRGSELVGAVPALEAYADVDVDQVAQVPSFEMDAETLESIGERVRELDGNHGVDAVVITHGTDTMEETAYYLDAAIQPEIPVFVTGAQRRPDEYSPDGPSNLLTAFRAADAFSAHDGSGVFVAFNEAVHAARHVTKTHTSKLEAFRSVGPGPVATVDRTGVALHRPPEGESDHVSNASLEADVYTIKSGSAVTGDLIDAAVERGADGLVVEGTGLGNVTTGIGTGVRDAIDQGVPVVITSRCLEGRLAPVYGGVGGGETLREHGVIFASDLPAQKARIKLMLALAAYDTAEEIRQVFAG